MKKGLTTLSILGVLAAGGVLVAGSGAEPVGKAATAACSLRVGNVITFSPNVTSSCSTTTTSTTKYFSGETLAARTGTLDFHTIHLFRCHESTAASDRIFPSATVALLHLRGTTWCKTTSQSKLITRTKNMTVFPVGTIFGISITDQGSVAKVLEGKLLIGSIPVTRTVTATAGFQVLVPFGKPPEQPQPILLDAEDQFATTLLRLDVLQSGPRQAAGWLKARGERTAVVIAQDDAVAEQLGRFLQGVKLATLTNDQVGQSDTAVPDAVAAVTARTVFVAGQLDTPLLERIRAQVGRLAVVLVPLGG